MAVYQIGEVIRRTRESLGISRTELCEGICTEQTLCRIETGKQVPNRLNFQALMERMGKCGNKYQLCMQEGMDEALEWEELNLLVASRKYEEVDKRLVEFENRLDLENAVNRQFTVRMRAIVDYEMGRINVCQKIELLTQALRCTVYKYEDGIIPNGILSRNEMLLFCNIATAYSEDNNLEKAIGMLQQAENYFQKTSIDIEERSVCEVFVMSNLARILGRNGNTKDAKQIEERLVSSCIKMRKGSNLANILYNLAFEEEVLQEKTLLPQKHLIQAYYTAELFDNLRTMNHINTHIENNYENNFLCYD